MVYQENVKDKNWRKEPAKTGSRDEKGTVVSTPWRRAPGFGPDKNTGKSPTVQPKSK